MKLVANKISVAIIILFILTSAYSCKVKKQAITTTDISSQRSQLQYIPKALHDTYLGMPVSDFKKARMVMSEKDSNRMNFRIEFTETIEDNDIDRVTYYFDKDYNQPLYEYIIEYKSATKLQELVKQKYGNHNDGNQWIFDSGEGFMIRVWTFKNKLCIAGVIKGTEWWDEK